MLSFQKKISVKRPYQTTAMLCSESIVVIKLNMLCLSKQSVFLKETESLLLMHRGMPRVLILSQTNTVLTLTPCVITTIFISSLSTYYRCLLHSYKQPDCFKWQRLIYVDIVFCNNMLSYYLILNSELTHRDFLKLKGFLHQYWLL